MPVLTVQASDLPDEDREIDRILALSRRAPINVDRDPVTKLYTAEAEALADIETARYALAPGQAPAHDLGRLPGTCKCAELGHPCVTRLFPSQAWFLRELRLHHGALGLMTVAAGKTFINVLAALAVECKHALLLIKPDQRHHYKLAYLRLREHFRVPSLVFHEGAVGGFTGAMIPGAPVLRVLPYSKLSRPEASALLEEQLADVDAVFADEVHCLSDRTSRRTARWIKFMARKKGQIPFAGSSGSMVKKTVDDIAHLSLFALGGGSPYPLDRNEVERWGAVIDPVRDPDLKSATYRKLRRVFGKKQGEESGIDSLFGGSIPEIRAGILDRVVHTPGVVSSRVSESTASITLKEWKPRKMPEAVAKLLANVRNRWERPDGEEFTEAPQAIECAKQVSVGFHYYWHYFDNPPRELVEAWKAARKAWCKEVRLKIAEDITHLDSEHLCENAAKRFYQGNYQGPLPVWQSETWPAWAEIRDQIRYEKRTRWHDDWFAQDLAEWASKPGAPGIVWCDSTALGHKVAEILGFPYHGGGPNAEEKILSEKGDRSVIASLNAHREGRDGLQHYFYRGLVAEPMSSGDGWHQLIGRYCRPGQPADTVELEVPLHVEEFRNALRSAYRFAEFDEGMNPNSQLLLAADPDEGVADCRG